MISDLGFPVQQHAGKVAGWLQTCNEEHEGCHQHYNAAQAARVSSGLVPELRFRLLDLKRGCVRDANLDDRYVALSYVSSSGPWFRLDKASLESVGAEGWLETIRSCLPRTISDAIDFIKGLGERYLWIDALCFAHDSKHETRFCGRLMTSVYRGSYFTLVAASGSDADAGLVQPSPGGNDHEQAQTDPTARDLNWHLSRSAYNQRGWTLGELVLSRRIVVFTGGHVFFSCPSSQRSDEAFSEKTPSFRLLSKQGAALYVPEPLSGLRACLTAYLDLTEEYSRRKIRSDSDALRAFGGINHALTAGLTGRSVQGLSDYLMDAFLLFISTTGNLRRRSEFGSYSWAGWEGEIRWPRETFVDKDGDPELEHGIAGRVASWMEQATFLAWRPPARLLSPPRRGPDWGDHEPVQRLADYIKEHPDEFPSQITEAYGQSGVSTSTFTGGSKRKAGRWTRLDDPLPDPNRHGPHTFSKWEFNAINSAGEFSRLAGQVLAGEEAWRERVVRSWLASAKSRTRLLKAERERRERRERESRDKHLEGGAIPDATDFALDSGVDDYDNEYRGVMYVPGRGRSRGDAYDAPYPVIQARTVCLRLSLGKPLRSGTERLPPTYTLFSASGKLVGSLHPDNISHVRAADSGPAVDLVVMSLSRAPTAGSALGEDASLAGENNLLWVLHVEWAGAVAQRRGIGQILASALTDALASGPEVRWVKLA